MSTHQKKSADSRSRLVRRTVNKVAITRSVVLDQVAIVRHRSGRGILRLKLIGPVDRLRKLRLVEGERIDLDTHQLTGEAA